MRVIGLVLTLLLAVLLSGCGGENGADSDETGQEGAATELPTATMPGAQLPATWTPSPEGFVATPLSSATPRDVPAGEGVAPAGAGQTIPATWTSNPLSVLPPTFESDATPTRPPHVPTVTPMPDWCSAMRVVSAPGVSYQRLPVHIMWEAVPNVASYRVELRNPGGGMMLSEDVTATEYMFPGDLFEMAHTYGWQVTPLDEDGNPICYSIADEIVVNVAPS